MSTQNDARFLFLAGGPRTGTSMLVRHFDAHPDLLVFPIEVSLLRDVARTGDCAEAAREYRAPAGSARKELFFIERARLEAYVGRLQAEGLDRADLYRQVDGARFAEALAAALRAPGPEGPGKLLLALGAALSAGHPAAGPPPSAGRALALKLPFYAEMAAPALAAALPGARFVHLLREPLPRYVSSKARRLRTRGGRVGAVGTVDYTTFQIELGIASRVLAEDNARRLGSRYVHVRFEDLVADSERALRGLCAALGLRYDPVLLAQTAFGQEQRVPSSHGFIDHEPERDAARRQAATLRITNADEREYVSARCEAAFGAPDPERLAALMRRRMAHEDDEAAELRRAAAGRLQVEALSARATCERVLAALRDKPLPLI